MFEERNPKHWVNIWDNESKTTYSCLYKLFTAITARYVIYLNTSFEIMRLSVWYVCLILHIFYDFRFIRGQNDSKNSLVNRAKIADITSTLNIGNKVNDASKPINKAKSFSGVYIPPKEGSEFYAGAWLAPKKRLLNSADYISKIVNLEGASFHLVLTAPGDNYRFVCMLML